MAAVNRMSLRRDWAVAGFVERPLHFGHLGFERQDLLRLDPGIRLPRGRERVLDMGDEFGSQRLVFRIEVVLAVAERQVDDDVDREGIARACFVESR